MDIIGGQHHLTAFPLLRMYPSIVCDRLYNSCMLSYVLFRFLNILKHRVVDLCRINTAETTAIQDMRNIKKRQGKCKQLLLHPIPVQRKRTAYLETVKDQAH